MKLTKKQELVVNSTEDKIVVNACAAAGKSECLTEKVRNVLKNSGIAPSKIVVITFTNNAADVLRERLGEDYKDGIFIGTIHSYVNQLLISHGVDTSKIIVDERFDELFKLLSENTYCVREVDYLFLDEAQDSTQEQFDTIFKYIKPKKWFLVGDWRQCIYSFNGARPDILIDIATAPDVKNYTLNENFRNARDILSYAKGIIRLAGYNYADNSVPMRELKGRVYDIPYDEDQIVSSLLRYKGDYSDWFILARTNAQVEEISFALAKAKIPFDTFKRSEVTTAELRERMEANTVKVLTIHGAKGLEAKNVIVIGARFYNLDERCISYVAATRARDLLVWMTVKNKKKIDKNMFKWE